MLTPRLTNCQDCHKIPDLLKKIDCKLAELANGAYNDVVFMLGNCIPAATIVQLLAYKRILTFKYCNPHYGGSFSVNDIAGKVIRLTSGCVSRCNEPVVCQITTCPIPIVPNPTTTTTTTSAIICEFSGDIICIIPITTTTTTTILPDCRVEGCFQVREVPPPPQCEEPFNTNNPEGFPNGITGNGTKTLTNGVVLTTTYTGPPISPTLLTTPGTEEVCDGVLINTYNASNTTQFPLLVGGELTLEFDPPVVSIALASTGYGYSSFIGDVETVTVGCLDPIIGQTLLSCTPNEVEATYETTQVNQNQVNLTGVQFSPSLQSGITVISPEAGGISRLVLSNNTDLPLAGVVFDLYTCGGVAPTTTTTTTVAPENTPCTDGLDVAFVIDYTFSMGDIIDNMKLGIAGIVNAIYTQSGAGGYRLSLITADEASEPIPRYGGCVDYTNLPNVQKIINGPNLSMDPANTGGIDAYQHITAWELFGDNNQATFNQQLQKLNGGVDGVCVRLGTGVYSSEPTDYAAKLVTESNFAGAFRPSVAKHIVILTDHLPGSTRDYFDVVTWQGIQDMITYANANGIKYFVLGEGVNKVGGGQGSSPVVAGIYPWKELAEQTGGAWNSDATSEEIQQQIIIGCGGTTTTTTVAPTTTTTTTQLETWDTNTYLVFATDTTASYAREVSRLATTASVPKVTGKYSAYKVGNSSIGPTVPNAFYLYPGNNGYPYSYIDSSSAYGVAVSNFVKIGMTVSGNNVPSGTVVTDIIKGYAGSGVPQHSLDQIVTNNLITTSQLTVITFEATAAMKQIDYLDQYNFRYLLQDYYASGQTLAEGNLDPATNGSDRFESHILYAPVSMEYQLLGLAHATNNGYNDGLPPNNTLPISTNVGDKFEGASRIIFQSFGDTSIKYTTTLNSTWSSRETETDPQIIAQLDFIKTTISNLETAVGNTSIYRGIAYVAGDYGYPTNADSLTERYVLLHNGCETGANSENLMYAYSDSELLVAESSGAPTRIKYVYDAPMSSGYLPNNSSKSTWYVAIKGAINQLGYNL